MQRCLFCFFISVLIVTVGCFVRNGNPAGQVNWLRGKWEVKATGTVLYEEWVKTGEGDLSGISYYLKGTDTVTLEWMTLTRNRDRLIFTAKTAGQNDGDPVSFPASRVGPDELIFTNRSHDFPQNISYRSVTRDSMVAEISGTVSGQFKSRVFEMKRIK